jgi:hypothetical protein
MSARDDDVGRLMLNDFPGAGGLVPLVIHADACRGDLRMLPRRRQQLNYTLEKFVKRDVFADTQHGDLV